MPHLIVRLGRDLEMTVDATRTHDLSPVVYRPRDRGATARRVRGFNPLPAPPDPGVGVIGERGVALGVDVDPPAIRATDIDQVVLPCDLTAGGANQEQEGDERQKSHGVAAAYEARVRCSSSTRTLKFTTLAASWWPGVDALGGVGWKRCANRAELQLAAPTEVSW